MERTLDFFHPPRNIKNRKVLIGIDPGVTTGLSVMIVQDYEHGVEGVMAWGSDQISYGGSANVKDLYDGDVAFPEQGIAKSIGEAICVGLSTTMSRSLSRTLLFDNKTPRGTFLLP